MCKIHDLAFLVMVRAIRKIRAKKIMHRARASFRKAWLDRAELLKTPGSRAKIRAEPRLNPALVFEVVGSFGFSQFLVSGQVGSSRVESKLDPGLAFCCGTLCL